MLCSRDIEQYEYTVGMVKLTPVLKKLRGHNYNIYECCFLAIGARDTTDKLLHIMVAESLIAQIVLLIILTYYNWRDITNVTSWNKDWGTILVIIITTAFFANKFVYEQSRDAYDFNAVFWKAGFPSKEFNKVEMQLGKILLWINIYINGGLGAYVLLFNIFFLLISKSVNEAFLNSLALFFILEIDDTLTPHWDEMHFDSLIAGNLLRLLPYGGRGVQVDIIPSSTAEDDYYSHLLESDDKDYLKVSDHDDQLVTVSWIWRRTRHDTVKFRISGENGRDFFNSIKEFDCVKKDVPSFEWRSLGLHDAAED